MPRQILKLQAQFQKFTNARIAHIEPGNPELRVERVVFIFEFEMTDQLGEPLDGLDIESEYFSHFARGGTAAIRDDVGRHRRAKRAVSLINVLNGALALIAA